MNLPHKAHTQKLRQRHHRRGRERSAKTFAERRDQSISHALAYAAQLAPTLPADQAILVNLSGRGDKDMHTVALRAGLQF